MQPIFFGLVADIDCDVIDDHFIKIYVCELHLHAYTYSP